MKIPNVIRKHRCYLRHNSISWVTNARLSVVLFIILSYYFVAFLYSPSELIQYFLEKQHRQKGLSWIAGICYLDDGKSRRQWFFVWLWKANVADNKATFFICDNKTIFRAACYEPIPKMDFFCLLQYFNVKSVLFVKCWWRKHKTCYRMTKSKN